MPFLYYLTLIATSMILGTIVSTRLSYVMGTRWGLVYNTRYNTGIKYLGFFQSCAAIGTAIICGLATGAAITFGGWLYGLIAALSTIPAVAFVWIFVVAANKVTTRMLAGMLVRVDTVNIDRAS